jgi:hypothetical protein
LFVEGGKSTGGHHQPEIARHEGAALGHVAHNLLNSGVHVFECPVRLPKPLLLVSLLLGPIRPLWPRPSAGAFDAANYVLLDYAF